MVVIGGSGGGIGRCGFQANQLAMAGFTALAVAYHGMEGLPRTLCRIPLECFAEAVGWLRERTGAQVVLLGASRGSEAALLTAALVDQVAGATALVPGNLVLCSWPPGEPAWTLEGKPLAYVSQFGPTSDNPDAVIPVELIDGPLLLVGAGQDTVWPSGAMVEAISHRRHDHGHDHDVVLHYAKADHNLGLLAPAGTADLPGDGEDRADAWSRLVDYLNSLSHGM